MRLPYFLLAIFFIGGKALPAAGELPLQDLKLEEDSKRSPIKAFKDNLYVVNQAAELHNENLQVSNIAKGKKASQSTTCWEGEASRAVDGNVSGNWGHRSTTHTCTNDHNRWWKVEVGQSIINRIVVWNRTDCCSDRLNSVKVEILNGGKVIASSHINGGRRTNTLNFSNAEGSEVKISGGHHYLSLAEVEVYGRPSISNIARGKHTSQSTTCWNGHSSRAVDGNNSGNYGHHSVTHTCTNDHNRWWKVKLGHSDISKIVVWNRSDCCADRLNNVKLDIYNGSKIIATNIINGAQRTTTLTFVNIQGTEVKISGGHHYLSLAEVEVFGKSTTPRGDPYGVTLDKVTLFHKSASGSVTVNKDTAYWASAVSGEKKFYITRKSGGQQTIVYERLKLVPASLDMKDLLFRNWFSKDNRLGVDFNLYSTMDDALAERNPWKFCNYDDPNVGFPRDCGPSHHIPFRWNAMDSNGRVTRGNPRWNQNDLSYTLEIKKSLEQKVLFEKTKTGHITVNEHGDIWLAAMRGADKYYIQRNIVVDTRIPTTHRSIVYERLTPIPAHLNMKDLMFRNWFSKHNKLGLDFNLYTNMADALAGRNHWRFCNYDDPNVGFPRDCGPHRAVAYPWGAMDSNGRVTRGNPHWNQNGLSFVLHTKKSHDDLSPGPKDVDVVVTDSDVDKECGKIQNCEYKRFSPINGFEAYGAICDTCYKAEWSLKVDKVLGLNLHESCNKYLHWGDAISLDTSLRATFPINIQITLDICDAALLFLSGGTSTFLKSAQAAKKARDFKKLRTAMKEVKKKEAIKKAAEGTCSQAVDMDPYMNMLSCIFGKDINIGIFKEISEILKNIINKFGSVTLGISGEPGFDLRKGEVFGTDDFTFSFIINLPDAIVMPHFATIKTVLLAVALNLEFIKTEGCHMKSAMPKEVDKLIIGVKTKGDSTVTVTCKDMFEIPEFLDDAVEWVGDEGKKVARQVDNYTKELVKHIDKCVDTIVSCNTRKCEITQETFYKMVPCTVRGTCTSKEWYKIWTYSCDIRGECKKPSFRDVEKCTQVLTTCIKRCTYAEDVGCLVFTETGLPVHSSAEKNSDHYKHKMIEEAHN